MGQENSFLPEWFRMEKIIFFDGALVEELFGDQLVLQHREAMPFGKLVFING
jgi:hypothetical protein